MRKKILPPEESASSPSPSYTAWNQLPTAALQEKNYRIPHLDRLLLPLPTRGILRRRDRHRLHPLQPAKHPVLCEKSNHPSHCSFRHHLRRRHLSWPHLYDAKKWHQRRINRTRRHRTPHACAVAAIRIRVTHLRQHGATPETHIAAVFNGVKWSTVRSAEITSALRAATTIIGPQVGFTPEDVSGRSMRAGSAMSLLMERVDTYTIRLVGRWRSKIMLHYLHKTAHTFTEGIAACMVQHRDYALIPPAQWD